MSDQTSIERLRRSELERAVRLLRNGKEPLEVFEAMSRRLTAKLLHAPTKLIHGAGR